MVSSMQQTKVLVAPERTEDGEAILRMLQDASGIQATATQGGLPSGDGRRFDAIIFSFAKAGCDPAEKLAQLRRERPGAALLGLVDGDEEGRRLGESLLVYGLDDYLQLGCFEERLLRRSIRYAVAKARLESSLQESERSYRTLFDSVADPVFVFDKETYRFLDCNDSVTRTYGYTRSELRKMTPKDLHPREELEVVRRNIDTKNVDSPNVYTHLTRDGRRIQVEILTNDIDYHGRPAWISIVHDVSQRARNQKMLEEARKQAEMASRSKGEFLANVSHEIRTPMNAIIGMTDLVLQTQLQPEQKEFLEIVQLSAESLLSLLNDILDFSKIEAGKLAMDPIEFGLRDMLGDTLRALTVRAHEKNLEVACHVDPKVPDMIIADPGRLRQIVANLVVNAIKFTDSGHILVRVREKSRGDDSVTLQMAVSDTGIGIPADKQQRIFEAFSQADGSTTRHYGGTGLGLAICSQLVSMMDGNIWVESEPGQGSTFHFTLRVGMAAKSRQFPSEPIDLKNLRVMVLEDLPVNQRITEEILSGWGMVVTVRSRGADGLKELKNACRDQTPYDLAILDVHLPEIDGFETARRIREDPEIESTTLLMLTSAAQRGDAARCRELGVEAYLTKPVVQSDLLDAIRAALAQPVESEQDEPAPLITRHSLRESRPRLQILLAEDNEVNQKLALRLLQKRGHTVVLAVNGAEALEKLAHQPFDIVLMDVQMPVMDGLEATREIRRREAPGQHVPIVAMTAFAMSGDRERCLEAGMDDYLSKPIKPPKLFETVERLGVSNWSAGSGEPSSQGASAIPQDSNFA